MNAVLIVCRNGLELTKRCIRSVLDQDIDVVIYVIDNDTEDGHKDILASYPKNKVLNWRFTPAKGVSASWNFGLEYLFDTAQCEKVLVLNNDTELKRETYRYLDLDGGPFVTAVSVDNIDGIKGGWAPSRRPHPDFSCFMIRREVWQKVGKFDESMVLYASDADYHLRMHQAGIHAYTIGIPFYHVASGTLKSAPEAERQRIQQQADMDRDTFERKWGCRVGSEHYYRLFEP
jgi:GT2 family glycosyltransferase